MIQSGQFICQTILCPGCGKECSILMSDNPRNQVKAMCVNGDCADNGAIFWMDKTTSMVISTDARYINGVRVWEALFDKDGNQVWPVPVKS